MSTVYNPTAVAPPTGYTIVSDGDAKTAASVNVPFQALMDNVLHLYQGGVASTVFTRPVDELPQSSGTATIGTDGTMTQNSTGGYLYWGLDLPNGCTLSSVIVYIDPAGGHTVFGNINKPTLAVCTLDPTDGTFTILGSTEATDPSGNISAYELRHSITKSGLAHTVNKEVWRYFVRLTLESGTDFQAGLKALGIFKVYTVTTRDAGAA